MGILISSLCISLRNWPFSCGRVFILCAPLLIMIGHANPLHGRCFDQSCMVPLMRRLGAHARALPPSGFQVFSDWGLVCLRAPIGYQQTASTHPEPGLVIAHAWQHIAVRDIQTMQGFHALLWLLAYTNEAWFWRMRGRIYRPRRVESVYLASSNIQDIHYKHFKRPVHF